MHLPTDPKREKQSLGRSKPVKISYSSADNSLVFEMKVNNVLRKLKLNVSDDIVRADRGFGSKVNVASPRTASDLDPFKNERFLALETADKKPDVILEFSSTFMCSTALHVRLLILTLM